MNTTGENRIMIYGPKNDGTYVVEFKTSEGEALAISVPAGETRVSSIFRNGCLMGCSCRTFPCRRHGPSQENINPRLLDDCDSDVLPRACGS
jgi:hypothetical protein